MAEQYWLIIGTTLYGDEAIPLAGGRQQRVAFMAGSVAFDGTTFSGTLYLSADDPAWLWTWFDQLNVYGYQAAHASSPTGHGQRVCLGVDLSGQQMLYADVQRATFTPTKRYRSGREMEVAVTLECWPWLRGEPYTIPSAGTITNGQTPTIFLEAVPGTLDALVSVDMTDVSTGGVVINRARFGIYGDRELALAGYPGVIDASAPAGGPDVLGSGVTSTADTDAIGGTRRTVTLTGDDWVTLSEVIVSAGGMQEFWARVQDTAEAGRTISITGLSTTSGSGSLAVGAWTYVVVAQNSTGKVLSVSDPASIEALSTANDNTNTIAFGGDLAAHHYSLYFRVDGGAWKLHGSTTTTSPFTHTTLTGSTTNTPPTGVSPDVANSLFRARVRLQGGQVVKEYPPVAAKVANGSYELLRLFRDVLPPESRALGSSPASTSVLTDVRRGGTSNTAVRHDGVWTFPREKLTVEYPGLGLATLRRWLITADLTERIQARLLSITTGATVGSLTTTGRLLAPPGNSVLVPEFSIGGGVSNVSDCKCTLQIIVTPRWSWLGGSVVAT